MFATLPTACTLELDGDDDVNDNGILAKLRQLELESFASASANVIPMSGFGTWQVNGDQCRKTVADALRLGYRHLDTAQAYGNEREVGEAVAMSGIPRTELFVATKLSERRSFEDARTLVLSQLREMQLDYFDLYMLHSPHPSFDIELKAWRESNCTMKDSYDTLVYRTLMSLNYASSIAVHASNQWRFRTSSRSTTLVHNAATPITTCWHTVMRTTRPSLLTLFSIDGRSARPNRRSTRACHRSSSRLHTGAGVDSMDTTAWSGSVVAFHKRATHARGSRGECRVDAAVSLISSIWPYWTV